MLPNLFFITPPSPSSLNQKMSSSSGARSAYEDAATTATTMNAATNFTALQKDVLRDKIGQSMLNNLEALAIELLYGQPVGVIYKDDTVATQDERVPLQMNPDYYRGFAVGGVLPDVAQAAGMLDIDLLARLTLSMNGGAALFGSPEFWMDRFLGDATTQLDVLKINRATNDIIKSYQQSRMSDSDADEDSGKRILMLLNSRQTRQRLNPKSIAGFVLNETLGAGTMPQHSRDQLPFNIDQYAQQVENNVSMRLWWDIVGWTITHVVAPLLDEGAAQRDLAAVLRTQVRDVMVLNAISGVPEEPIMSGGGVVVQRNKTFTTLYYLYFMSTTEWTSRTRDYGGPSYVFAQALGDFFNEWQDSFNTARQFEPAILAALDLAIQDVALTSLNGRMLRLNSMFEHFQAVLPQLPVDLRHIITLANSVPELALGVGNYCTEIFKNPQLSQTLQQNCTTGEILMHNDESVASNYSGGGGGSSSITAAMQHDMTYSNGWTERVSMGITPGRLLSEYQRYIGQATTSGSNNCPTVNIKEYIERYFGSALHILSSDCCDFELRSRQKDLVGRHAHDKVQRLYRSVLEQQYESLAKHANEAFLSPLETIRRLDAGSGGSLGEWGRCFTRDTLESESIIRLVHETSFVCNRMTRRPDPWERLIRASNNYWQLRHNKLVSPEPSREELLLQRQRKQEEDEAEEQAIPSILHQLFGLDDEVETFGRDVNNLMQFINSNINALVPADPLTTGVRNRLNNIKQRLEQLKQRLVRSCQGNVTFLASPDASLSQYNNRRKDGPMPAYPGVNPDNTGPAEPRSLKYLRMAAASAFDPKIGMYCAVMFNLNQDSLTAANILMLRKLWLESIYDPLMVTYLPALNSALLQQHRYGYTGEILAHQHLYSRPNIMKRVHASGYAPAGSSSASTNAFPSFLINTPAHVSHLKKKTVPRSRIVGHRGNNAREMVAVTVDTRLDDYHQPAHVGLLSGNLGALDLAMYTQKIERSFKLAPPNNPLLNPADELVSAFHIDNERSIIDRQFADVDQLCEFVSWLREGLDQSNQRVNHRPVQCDKSMAPPECRSRNIDQWKMGICQRSGEYMQILVDSEAAAAGGGGIGTLSDARVAKLKRTADEFAWMSTEPPMWWARYRFLVAINAEQPDFAGKNETLRGYLKRLTVNSEPFRDLLQHVLRLQEGAQAIWPDFSSEDSIQTLFPQSDSFQVGYRKLSEHLDSIAVDQLCTTARLCPIPVGDSEIEAFMSVHGAAGNVPRDTRRVRGGFPGNPDPVVFAVDVYHTVPFSPLYTDTYLHQSVARHMAADLALKSLSQTVNRYMQKYTREWAYLHATAQDPNQHWQLHLQLKQPCALLAPSPGDRVRHPNLFSAQRKQVVALEGATLPAPANGLPAYQPSSLTKLWKSWLDDVTEWTYHYLLPQYMQLPQ